MSTLHAIRNCLCTHNSFVYSVSLHAIATGFSVTETRHWLSCNRQPSHAWRCAFVGKTRHWLKLITQVDHRHMLDDLALSSCITQPSSHNCGMPLLQEARPASQNKQSNTAPLTHSSAHLHMHSVHTWISAPQHT